MQKMIWLLFLALAMLTAPEGPTSIGRAFAEEPAPLSHAEIKSTVDKHLPDVKACMKAHGSATGKLVVEFAILPDGKVNEPKPKESSSNGALDRCIAKAFAGWTFPQPRGGVVMGVVYPFVFSAPKPPPQGKLSEEQIATLVKAKRPDLKACYDEAAKDKPDLRGVVKVAMVISPAGVVTEAKAQESDTKSAKLDSCLVGKIKGWQFPKPDGGEAAILCPFSFP